MLSWRARVLLVALTVSSRDASSSSSAAPLAVFHALASSSSSPSLQRHRALCSTARPRRAMLLGSPTSRNSATVGDFSSRLAQTQNAWIVPFRALSTSIHRSVCPGNSASARTMSRLVAYTLLRAIARARLTQRLLASASGLTPAIAASP
eukprot:Amastigsp_a346572_5.p2 type:complete len:150 gc:universal Amastigsp_a346572_5:799-350(-)